MSNYNYVIYYYSEICNTLNLQSDLKQRLLSASANALKVCTPMHHNRISYLELHKMKKRATPSEMSEYKHTLLLVKLVNTEILVGDWVNLRFQQTFSKRSNSFNF